MLNTRVFIVASMDIHTNVTRGCCWCKATRRNTIGHVKSERPEGHGVYSPYREISSEVVEYRRSFLGGTGYITDECPERPCSKKGGLL